MTKAVGLSSLLVIVLLSILAVLPLDTQTARYLGALLGLIPAAIFGWFASKAMSIPPMPPIVDSMPSPPDPPCPQREPAERERFIGDDSDL